LAATAEVRKANQSLFSLLPTKPFRSHNTENSDVHTSRSYLHTSSAYFESRTSVRGLILRKTSSEAAQLAGEIFFNMPSGAAMSFAAKCSTTRYMIASIDRGHQKRPSLSEYKQSQHLLTVVHVHGMSLPLSHISRFAGHRFLAFEPTPANRPAGATYGQGYTSNHSKFGTVNHDRDQLADATRLAPALSGALA
jgi:hypothetical protein